jgi:hypothetical protein
MTGLFSAHCWFSINFLPFCPAFGSGSHITCGVAANASTGSCAAGIGTLEIFRRTGVGATRCSTGRVKSTVHARALDGSTSFMQDSCVSTGTLCFIVDACV